MIIERIIKSRDKIKLILSDHTSLRISESTLAKYLLYQGKDIDKEQLIEICNDDIQADIIALCIDLISRRPRSVYEIRTYLKKKYKDSIDSNLITTVITYLTDKGYLNDESFCKWWIENRISFRPKSPLELTKELTEHGIESDDIKYSLAKYYDQDTERELLKSLLNKKFNLDSIADLPLKEKQRIISYFLRKGYNYDLIKEELM